MKSPLLFSALLFATGFLGIVLFLGLQRLVDLVWP